MRALKFWVIMIAALAVTSVLIGFGWLRSSLPRLDGTVTLAGVEAPVTVARDAHGVPHIDAASDRDLMFALGYVHAQDRLWQMEMSRRIGNGRLSELLGDKGLGFDKYFRTLGFANRARSAWEKLDKGTQDALQVYADGVNAFLDTHAGALPPEFVIIGTEPEHWSPIDTLVWQKMMWLDLSGNMRQELARARLLTKLTPDQLAAIFPTYPGDKEGPFPDLSAIYASLPLEKAIAMIGEEPSAAVGSNNWVVSGDRTRSGKPLLANDPHLGLTTPSIWYLTRLYNRTTGKNLVGVGFPGSPSIILGRNDHIAWGFTNTAPDVQDLFIEKLTDDGARYLTPDGPADFVIRDELIKVKGGEDVLLKVRETRHGPVVTDILSGDTDFLETGYALALQWTALMQEDTAVTGLLALAHAGDFDGFKAAGQFYFGPEQNMIYADTSGNIGYYAPALVPVRAPENEIMGRLPSPGWIAKYDWQGFIPYEDLPTRLNPEGGIIATANEKIVADDYPHFITRDWTLPYRGNRIRHLLEATEKHDLESFRAVQQDITSDLARELMPLLRGALMHEADDSGLLKAFLSWDGEMDKSRPEPLAYHAFMRAYQKALMADELGDLYSDFERQRPRLIKSSLFWSDIPRNKMATPYYELPPIDRDRALAWCDDVTTADKAESCVDLARAAWASAKADLAAAFGADWKTWQWGSAHMLYQTHRPFSQVPGLKNIFELASPVSGSVNTINVGGVSQNEATLFNSTYGPSYRGIFDLSDLDKSLYAQPTGQSGNPMSSHYGDLFPLWRDGEYFTIPAGDGIPKDAAHILTLRPMR